MLSVAGLSRSTLYRSSFSGGWHLYITFDEPISSSDLRQQLVKLLTLSDYEVAKGQLEVFPNPGTFGSQGLGLRLPLQPGFAWLDKSSLEVEYERARLSATKALELFLDDFQADANTFACFRQLKSVVADLESRKASATARALPASTTDNVVPLLKAELPLRPSDYLEFVEGVFRHLPPGIIVDNWYKGRLYHLSGLTGPSQRAESIECLGHYLFYGDPSRDLAPLGYGYEQERQWAIREFLETRNNGQSKDIERNRPDALAQVERAAHWRPARLSGRQVIRYTPERPVSWIRENANRQKNARTRIQNALQDVSKGRRSFTTVELQQAAGCSRETLYKHADLWRKQYEDLAAGFFANCTDDHNVVVGAASSEKQSPAAGVSRNMPPGRLAARRMAHELNYRIDRERRQRERQESKTARALQTKWKERILQAVPADLSALDNAKLHALLRLIQWLSAGAGDEDEHLWVGTILAQIKAAINSRGSVVLTVVRAEPGDNTS